MIRRRPRFRADRYRTTRTGDAIDPNCQSCQIGFLPEVCFKQPVELRTSHFFGEERMKLARRAVLRLGAGAAALPLVPTILGSQSVKAANVSTEDPLPLARRLAGYALNLLARVSQNEG